jgi:hypothetical protein
MHDNQLRLRKSRLYGLPFQTASLSRKDGTIIPPRGSLRRAFEVL